MMDEVAYQLGIDPVEFTLKNMRRPTEQQQFTNYSLEEVINNGAQRFNWQTRRRVTPGSDEGPIKRGAGFSFMMFRAGVGTSSAILRTTIMTGIAVVEAAEDLKRQIADRGMPTGSDVLVASATPTPTTDGMTRQCFGAHFVEVEVDTRIGSTKILKYTTVHESGRIINPSTARDQIRGATIQGIGSALYEDLLYDPQSGQPLTPGYYRGRHLTHKDIPDIDVHFIEVDDGYGPFGAKTAGESGIILAPAAVANAVANAIGKRMTSLPITRDKILGAMA